jgi:hypothetical protein
MIIKNDFELTRKQVDGLLEILKEREPEFKKKYNLTVRDIKKIGAKKFFNLMGVNTVISINRMIENYRPDMFPIICPHCKKNFGMHAIQLREIGLCTECQPLYDLTDFWERVEKKMAPLGEIADEVNSGKGVTEAVVKKVEDEYDEAITLIAGFIKDNNIRVMHQVIPSDELVSKIIQNRFRGIYMFRYIYYIGEIKGSLEWLLLRFKNDFEDKVEGTDKEFYYRRFCQDIQNIFDGNSPFKNITEYAYSLVNS